MRKLTHIAVTAVIAGGVAHTASAASPTSHHALSVYLGKVKPLNASVFVAETALLKAERAAKHGQNNTSPAAARKDLKATLLTSARKLSRIVPPANLRAANAAFVSSLRLEARGTDGRANRLRMRWRNAVLTQLHRAGLAVPKWVELVRDPLA
jgi:hypothetical protein